MILHRLTQFIHYLIARFTRPTTAARKSAGSPFKFTRDGTPIHIEFDGMVLTFRMIEKDDDWIDDVYVALLTPRFEENTILFRPANLDAPDDGYYRDEDGELRPLHSDRESLSEIWIEELAAEYLRAKADAEVAPDALERKIISALRDAYGRELWRRVTTYGITNVEVGGRHYEIVPLPFSGCVRLVKIE